MKKTFYFLVFLFSAMLLSISPLFSQVVTDTLPVQNDWIADLTEKISTQFNIIFTVALPIFMYLSEKVAWIKKNLNDLKLRTVIISVLLIVALIGLGSDWKSFIVPFLSSPFVYEWILKPIFGGTKPVKAVTN